jgi:hypothetical protein
MEYEIKDSRDFHDDRSIPENPWVSALEVGLGTCTWGFALQMEKSQVPYKSHFNGALEVESLGLCLHVGTIDMSGTWDLAPSKDPI